MWIKLFWGTQVYLNWSKEEIPTNLIKIVRVYVQTNSMGMFVHLCKEILLEQWYCLAVMVILTSQARDCTWITFSYRRNCQHKEIIEKTHLSAPFPWNLCVEYTRSASCGPFLSQCLIFWLSNNVAAMQWRLSLPLSHWNLFLQSTSTMLQSLAGKHGRESTNGSVQAWPPNWDGRRSVRTRNWKAERIQPGLFVWADFVAKCPPRQTHMPRCCEALSKLEPWRE